MTDYTDMDGVQLIEHCRDDAAKWAAAFRQTAIRLGYSDMDEEWLTGWFANAMQTCMDVRFGASPVRFPDGSGAFIGTVETTPEQQK